MSCKEKILHKDEELNVPELLEASRKKSPVEKAEIIIREYCKVMFQDETLDREFDEWLKNNIVSALRTQTALEMYFCKFLDTHITPVSDDAKQSLKALWAKIESESK